MRILQTTGYCQNFVVVFFKTIDEFNYRFWMMIMSSFKLKTYFTRSFQHSVSISTNFLAFFLQHLFEIRMIPSAAKHKQTKTAQQQIHSHLNKVHVSRFPAVSNELIQKPYSVAFNKHTLSFDPLHKTMNERTSFEAGASRDPAILKNIS